MSDKGKRVAQILDSAVRQYEEYSNSIITKQSFLRQIYALAKQLSEEDKSLELENAIDYVEHYIFNKDNDPIYKLLTFKFWDEKTLLEVIYEKYGKEDGRSIRAILRDLAKKTDSAYLADI